MTKIEYAVAASSVFINNLHREGFDRGMIATFGNTFRVEQSFTSSEAYLHAALSQINVNQINKYNESTRLYNSIADIIAEFWRTGMRDRSWLLTVITDGMDNDEYSGKYGPIAIGHHIANVYTNESSNFIFVIGVGQKDEIDRSSLSLMAEKGDFKAITIESFPLLEAVFLQIALNVSMMLVGRKIETKNFSWEEVMHIRETSHIPIDYAFLIDRSGSMGNLG